MNRSALKSPCILVLGVALGCAIGRPPRGSGGAGAESDRLPDAEAQSGAGAGYGAGLAGSGGEAGIRRAGGRPSRERLEMLAASFRQKCRQGNEMAVAVSVSTEAAGLAEEEFGPLLGILVHDSAQDDLDQADLAQRTVELLAVRWAMLDPKAALAFALEEPEIKGNTSLITSIFQELARTDLPAAKAALARLNDRGQRQETVEAVVSVLQQRDPQAALAFAREFENPRAEAEALLRMAADDPTGAAAQLTPGREDQRPAVAQIAESLLKRDRAEFEAWWGGLRDPIQRGAARFQALSMDAAIDPKGAAQAAAAWLAAEPEAVEQVKDRGLSERIVKLWVEAGAPPAEVAAWAAGLLAGPFRDETLAEAGRLWMDQDMMAASAWAASLPEGAGRDNVICGLVKKISNDSPADAFEWARTVVNPSWRYNILMPTLRSWAEKDSAAAVEAVESLPAGEQGYLLDALQEQRKAKERK